MNIELGKLYRINWTARNERNKPCVMETVGYIIRELDDVVLVASTHSDDDVWTNTSAVNLKNIKSVVELYVAPKGRVLI